jgi:hypothetical protein
LGITHATTNTGRAERPMELLLASFLLAAAIWYFWGYRALRAARASSALSGLSDFHPTFLLKGVNRVTLSVDARTRRIAILDERGRLQIYEPSEILRAEIHQDTVSFSKTNKLSQVVSALVWNTLFGSKGFRVGGLSGSTSTFDQVNALWLRVYLADIARPLEDVALYQGRALATKSGKYHEHMRTAEEWKARLNLALPDPELSEPAIASGKKPASRLRGKSG